MSMIDLFKISGLPISWDAKSVNLVLGKGIISDPSNPDIRRRSDMQEVLYDSQAEELNELYYMYRGLALANDIPLIERFGLRYDITVIRPGTISGEFVKTAGHYHPQKPGTDVTWPEVYEVLHGRAHYLLQSHVPGQPDRLEQVYLIAAKPGDKVLIPPGFGHITINPGDDYLIMCNWVVEDFSSVYEPMKQMKGGAYYELKSDNGAPQFVPNQRYNNLPELKRAPVVEVDTFALITGMPLYSAFKQSPYKFKYLNAPEEYGLEFHNYLEQLLQG